jgi:hypothetical protein
MSSAPGEWPNQLLETRRRFRKEMRLALLCKGDKRKKVALAKRWKKEYSAIGYEELVACARNKEACRGIAEWKLEGD